MRTHVSVVADANRSACPRSSPPLEVAAWVALLTVPSRRIRKTGSIRGGAS